MIVGKRNLRISFFGGTTDFESFYKTFGSFIISVSIDQYSYIAARFTPRIMNYHTRINYSITETVQDNKDIQHNGVRGVLSYLNIKEPLELSHFCDIPSQTGLGSSSSFIICLLQVLYKLCFNHTPSKKQLADDAIYIERKLLAEFGGIQDEIQIAYSGCNSIQINTDGSFIVRPLPVSEQFLEEFRNSLVLFYLGDPRQSFKISADVDKIDEKTIIHKKAILDIAKEAYKAFENEDIPTIGKLLDESWKHKKGVSDLTSNTKIDMYYQKAKDLGGYSGKILGAGGGGGFLVICPPEKRQHLIDHMGIPYVDFNFDFNGSKLL